jgi:SAM-dependent methyltransferase
MNRPAERHREGVAW